MAKSAVFFVVLWVLMAIPVVGTALALVIAGASLIALSPVLDLLKPIVDWQIARGVPGGLAVAIPLVMPFALLAMLIVWEGVKQDRTSVQRLRTFTALMWVVGIPLTVALAWWLVPRRFG